MSAQESPLPFSLSHAGLFHRALRAIGLQREDGRDLERQALAWVAVAWVPLMVLALIHRAMTHSWSPFLFDVSVHARLLVALPLLLATDETMHHLSARCVRRFVRGGFADGGTAAIAGVVRPIARARDMVLPEIAIAVVAIVNCQIWLWSGETSDPLRVWYACVSLPIFQILFFRWVWLWFLWVWFLWRSARLHLRPVAGHPDGVGGLAFFAEPTYAFVLIAMAGTSVLSGAWANQILYSGAKLPSFSGVACCALVVAALIAVGPLLFFMPTLWRTRNAGVLQYGHLSLDYARRFEEQWTSDGVARDPLATPDIQSMADLGAVYERVHDIRLIPFTLQHIIVVVAAAALPMLPLFLTVMSPMELLQRIGKTLLGHRG